jgi:hypothetical protein
MASWNPTFKPFANDFIQLNKVGEQNYVKKDKITSVVVNGYIVCIYIGSSLGMKESPFRLDFKSREDANEFAESLMFHLSSEQSPPSSALKDTLVTIKGMLDGVKVVQGELNHSVSDVTGEVLKLRELFAHLDARMKSCEESLSDEVTEPETELEVEPAPLRNHVDVLHKEPSPFMKSIISFLIVVLLISAIHSMATNRVMLRLT